MIKNKNFQLFGFLIGSALASTVLFQNCAGQVGEMQEEQLLSLSCGTECGSAAVHPDQFKVDNVSGEVLDVRQTLESYLSLLELTPTDLGTDLTSILTEKNRRSALLPQENNSSLASSVAVLSQASMAGEVCRVWVQKKAVTSWMLSGVNLRGAVTSTPKNNWVNYFNRFAEQAWGRPLESGEVADVEQFVSSAVAEASKSKALNATVGGLNVESANLATMICTGVLTAPESTML